MALKEVSHAPMSALMLSVRLRENMGIKSFVELMERLFGCYPELIPEKMGAIEPLKVKYSHMAFRNLVNNPAADEQLIWKGKRLHGSTHKLTHSLHRIASLERSESEVWHFDFDRSAVSDRTVSSVSDELAGGCLIVATLHAVSSPEIEHCKSVGAGWIQGEAGYSFHSTFLDQRAFGLPTLSWRTYFGESYINHFGRDRLLAAPAYRVNEVRPNVISMQLTESVGSIETDWDRFHAVRQRVISHLGAESFQRPRVAGDPPPLGENDRNGVPGTAIPPELIPVRQELEEWYDKEHRPRPSAIENLDDLLSDPKRFRVVQIAAGRNKTQRVIVDTAREEMIGFADPKLRDEWIEKLLANGAQFKDLS